MATPRTSRTKSEPKPEPVHEEVITSSAVPASKGMVSYDVEKSWQAPTIDSNAIQKTLEELWMQISERKVQASGKPVLPGSAAIMRTRTINLISVVDSMAEADRVRHTVTELKGFFPSRTVILVRNIAAGNPSQLAVTVSAEEHQTARPQAPIRFETITVSGSADREELLASVAVPILVPELPEFVWCQSPTFYQSPLLSELLESTDRLVVDTSAVKDPGSALRYMVTLVGSKDFGELHISDSAWTRITPWRQMIAQFFDHATMIPSLNSIESVTITYGAPNEDGRSGFTAGLLMAGWLSTRLGLRSPGEEMVPSKDGWKLTLRAGEKGKSREVTLTIKPTNDPAAGFGLAAVEIVAGGNAPGLFRISRESEDSVRTICEAASKIDRIVYLRNLNDARILNLELRVFGSDPIYDEALAFAANLSPEGVEL